MISLNDITARNTPGTSKQLKNKKVAIAGLGGLGSNIAVMLSRIGVGKLLLVDFDRVEPSNLNRQHYNTTHIGMYKTEALKKQLELINPFVETDILTVKITEDNVGEVFKNYEIVCEAFDSAENKAILVNHLLLQDNKKIIAASGMNGYDSANKIVTRRALKNLYVCGDFVPAEEDGVGFMSPRVMVCAGHQANMILRLLLEEKTA